MIEINVTEYEPVFTISTAAKILDISVHTLRMYEREGLFIPFKKESNQRLYSKADIERLKCVRSAINESKISINGIKAIYSMIPCWDVVNCSKKDRQNCEAYNNVHQPCWSYNHKNNVCAKLNCRDCKVYNDYSECGKVKELMKSITK